MSKAPEKVEVRDFAIFLICYGRPDFCMKHSWRIIENTGSKAKRYILCSSDDKTIPEYQKMFGKENVFIFDKEEAERDLNIDVGDCFDGQQYMRKGAVWVRNAQFRIAREHGIRHFIVIDDDTTSFAIRYEEKGQLKHDAKIPYGRFDEMCEMYFRMLDSAPFMDAVALGQGGDYIGGTSCALWKKQHRFKAMNSWFCDTEKEFRYYGRMNDDVNGYVVNSGRGKLCLTLAGAMLDQLPTQAVSGGMTDIYKKYGTWLKSMYSVMMTPASVKINAIGNTKETYRIHHFIDWKSTAPKVVSGRFAKSTPLDYRTEVCQDIMQEGKIPPKTTNFQDVYSNFNTDLAVISESMDDLFDAI